MFFKFVPVSGSEIDLSDYVDVVPTLTFRRIDASTGGGIFQPSVLVGDSFTEAFEVTAEGTLFAPDYSSLRTLIANILRGRRGYLMTENDRRVPASLIECRVTDWQHGLSLARLQLQFLCAGYAESVSESYATAISGGWSVNNTGDLPAPVYITAEFANTQSSQKVLFLGGVAPNGRIPRSLEFQANVSVGDVVDIDAGVYGIYVRLNAFDCPQCIRAGYPFYAKPGTSTISYSFVPANSFLRATLTFRRRWLML
jgi:hypothetical protein